MALDMHILIILLVITEKSIFLQKKPTCVNTLLKIINDNVLVILLLM